MQSAQRLDLRPEEKLFITPQKAVEWFLLDMAEVSGFILSGIKSMSPLSVYATYRPILTQPDPWYYAGVVALESSAITDLFTPKGADDILREIFEQMDRIIGRDDKDASGLTFMLMGRLGLGAVLMGRKVPENMLSKIMLLLIGSDRSSKRVMPDDSAPAQLRAALKSGPPIWWKMFARRYRLTTAPDAAIEARIRVPQATSSVVADIELPESVGDMSAAAAKYGSGLNLDMLKSALVEADIVMPGPANDESQNVIDAAQPANDESDILINEIESKVRRQVDHLPFDDGALDISAYRVD